MHRAIRNIAYAEGTLGVVFGAVFVVDRLGIGGPDSMSTAVLAFLWLATATVTLACFVFYLPGSVRIEVTPPI
jgi:hypothetical protein